MEADPAERKTIVWEIERKFAEDIWLAHKAFAGACMNNLAGRFAFCQ